MGDFMPVHTINLRTSYSRETTLTQISHAVLHQLYFYSNDTGHLDSSTAILFVSFIRALAVKRQTLQTDLAVTLREMQVSEREFGPFHMYRQERPGPSR